MANSAQNLNNLADVGLTQKQTVQKRLPKRGQPDVIKLTIQNTSASTQYVAVMGNVANVYDGVVILDIVKSNQVKGTTAVPGGIEGMRSIFRDLKPKIIGFNYSCVKTEDIDQFDLEVYQLQSTAKTQTKYGLNDVISGSQSYNDQEQFMRLIPYAFALNGQNDLVFEIKANATIALFFKIADWQVLNS